MRSSTTRRQALAFLATTGLALASASPEAEAATAAEINQKVDLALDKLYRDNPAAKTLSEKAKAVLVFPEIVKGGFIVGGQYGEGALRKAGAAAGYYSIASASFGLQAGAQSFAEALFFMSDEALGQLTKAKGFELGVDASVAVADKGKGGQLSTATMQSPIIAFVFGQQGLMAGISLQGSKITKIEPSS